MTIEIQWRDRDPDDGERRLLRAEKFGGVWRFSWRRQRYERWLTLQPTRTMWEHVLDSLHRRYRRREGVTDEDIAQVERLLREWRGPPGEEQE